MIYGYVRLCYLQAAVRLSGELAAIKIVKLESRTYITYVSVSVKAD